MIPHTHLMLSFHFDCCPGKADSQTATGYALNVALNENFWTGLGSRVSPSNKTVCVGAHRGRVLLQSSQSKRFGIGLHCLRLLLNTVFDASRARLCDTLLGSF